MTDYQQRLEWTDCRNAGRFYELSGSHCPPNKPCDRCQWEREEAWLQARIDELEKFIVAEVDPMDLADRTMWDELHQKIHPENYR